MIGAFIHTLEALETVTFCQELPERLSLGVLAFGTLSVVDKTRVQKKSSPGEGGGGCRG